MQPAFEFPVVTEDLKKVLEIGKLANYQWQSLSHVEISILIQTWQQKIPFLPVMFRTFRKGTKQSSQVFQHYLSKTWNSILSHQNQSSLLHSSCGQPLLFQKQMHKEGEE